MKKLLNSENVKVEKERPLKIIQFGEGNFLRAFVDYAIHTLNVQKDFNAGVAIVQPIAKGMVDLLDQQDGLYTVFSNGISKGEKIQEKHLITCVEKCIDPYKGFEAYKSLAREKELQFVVSNTTEAGISFDEEDKLEMEPPNSFPAKLTVLLHERYQHFNGAADKGLTILPCELINYNADNLKSIILRYIELWNLEDGFKIWINECNSFHNTLVDRIVPGYPKNEIDGYNEQLDYEDNLLVTSEIFFLWVIEGGDALKQKLPFEGTGLDVKIVKDLQPYRTRKVRILNGAHTVMVPMSILFGNGTVKETLDNDFTGKFVNDSIFEEIIPTLELNQNELEQFAHSVLDRFRNPFIKHELASIALNSISKFKVRVLPSFVKYYETYNKLPVHLTFAFACLLRFYKRTWKGEELPVKDDEKIMEHLAKLWEMDNREEMVLEMLAIEDYWGRDLNQIDGFSGSNCCSFVRSWTSWVWKQPFINIKTD